MPYTACEIISDPNIRKKKWNLFIAPVLCFFGVLLPLSPTGPFLLIRSYIHYLGPCEKNLNVKGQLHS